MKNFRAVSVLSFLTAILAAIAAATGIFYHTTGESYLYTSIRGKQVEIFGRGLYQHMSSEVAVQGIAHDYVTLFLAVPALMISLYLLKNGSLRNLLFHAGVLKFFFITFLFYMNMGMYNFLFPLYILLVSTSFFALVLVLLEIDIPHLKSAFRDSLPRKFLGGVLILISVAIALLWLEIIITPLLDGSIFPVSVEHYTTLTVQGFDLSLLLPITFLAGLLLLQRKNWGYLLASVTLVFLCFLMSALVAKIIAMAMIGVNVVPVIFIIPSFLMLTIISCILLFRNIYSTTIYSSSSSIHTGA